MNYNNSPELFRNAHGHYRDRRIVLTVVDGHVLAGTDGIVARFDNDQKAVECLLEAGYVREPLTGNFHPPPQ